MTQRSQKRCENLVLFLVKHFFQILFLNMSKAITNEKQLQRLGMISCSQLYYKEQILLKYTLLQEDSVNEHFNAVTTASSSNSTILLLWDSVSSSVKSRSLTRRPLKFLLKSHVLKCTYNDSCEILSSHQGMSGEMGKADDRWLFWAAWLTKPKAKILFLKPQRFPTFSPAFNALGQWFSLWN